MQSGILVDRLGNTLWLIVAVGEHDLATADHLDQALTDIERHGTDTIVDLSEATFIDSSILRVLLQHAKKPGERLAIISPPRTVPRRLFDLVMPDPRLVPICDTRDDALRHLGR